MTREVINELKKYTVGKKNTEKTEISVLNLNRFIFALEEQESKTGRWIVDLQTATEDYYICSECGRRIHLLYPDTIGNYPYCHCGAKMVEPKEESEG